MKPETFRSRYILGITLAYATFALVWIFLSDHLLASFTDIASLLWLSTAKGIFFVLATAAMFFVALRAVPDDEKASKIHFVRTLNWSTGLTRRARWATYSFAVAITLAMLVVRLAMAIGASGGPMLILFMLPIIVSAVFGGLGPGLVSTALSAIGVYAFVLAPSPQINVFEAHNDIQLAALVANGMAVSLLSSMLRNALDRAESQRALMDAAISGTSDAVFVKDRLGRYQLVNTAAANFLDRTASDIVGRDDSQLFPMASALLVKEKDRAVMASGQTQTHEETIQFNDGQVLVFLVTKGPVRDAKGNTTGIFGVSRDITQRKKDELERQERTKALKTAQRIAHLGNWSWNLAHNTKTWSEEVYRIFDRNPILAPANFQEFSQYFTPSSWLTLNSELEIAKQKEHVFECDAQIVLANGLNRWVTARGESVLDEQRKVVELRGTIQDITERQLTLNQLHISQDRLTTTLSAIRIGVWTWDMRSGEVYRSPQYYQVIGHSPEADSGGFDFLFHIVHPSDLPDFKTYMAAQRASGSSVFDYELRVVTENGEDRWINSRGRAVEHDTNGRPVRFAGTLEDISERKRLYDDLQLVLNEAGDAIWIADPGGQYIYANPSACTLTGYTLEQTRQLRIADLIDPESSAELAAHIAELGQGRIIRREWRMLRRDGSKVSVELTTERMRDGRYAAFGRDLTEKKLAEAAIHHHELLLARVVEGSDQGFWEWNLQTNKFQVSARWETMLGYQAGEMDVSVEQWGKHVHPDDLAAAHTSIQRHIAGETPSHEAELRCKTKGGDWRWIVTRGRIVEWDEQGKPLIMAGSHTDIAEQKAFELAQREASTVFESSYEGLMVVNAEGIITRVNPAFSRITGFSVLEAVGNRPNMLASSIQPPEFYKHMWNAINTQDFWQGEIWNRRKNGEVYAELLSISVVRGSMGEVEHYIGVFSDISRIKAHEAELDKIAHYDPLTGVPNRRLLADRMAQAIARTNRGDSALAVCYLDLDGFKEINDAFGHPAGDQLLVGVTEHLKNILRAEDTLARLGGDEFVLLLSDINTPEECSIILERVLTAASGAVHIDGQTVRVSASIGVSLYPQDHVDADTLLRHADQAMYQAKQAGKNRFHLFDPESDRKAQLHRNYIDRVRTAMEQDELVLHYQPKVNLLSGEVIGVEALLRWQHPERGLLPPSEFLPHIQSSTLEQPLGEWVIRTALRQAAQWKHEGLVLRVSVNISADHLVQADFQENLAKALAAEPDTSPQMLELEVLETAAFTDIGTAGAILKNCQTLGVQFALDDFGTGYSSLTYLRKLPVNTLKIDQSFVRDMLTDSEDKGIVESVIRLAGAFNREVIAEGVETMDIGAALLALGCHLAQGYGIARPMPAAALLAWTQQWTQQERWKTMQA